MRTSILILLIISALMVWDSKLDVRSDFTDGTLWNTIDDPSAHVIDGHKNHNDRLLDSEAFSSDLLSNVMIFLMLGWFTISITYPFRKLIFWLFGAFVFILFVITRFDFVTFVVDIERLVSFVSVIWYSPDSYGPVSLSSLCLGGWLKIMALHSRKNNDKEGNKLGHLVSTLINKK